MKLKWKCGYCNDIVESESNYDLQYCGCHRSCVDISDDQIYSTHGKVKEIAINNVLMEDLETLGSLEPDEKIIVPTDEHMVYMSDDMYLPIHYRGIKVKQPYYSGDGNLSVNSLEKLCNEFQEYIHQQQVIKQNCMQHIVELKFNVKFENTDD